VNVREVQEYLITRIEHQSRGMLLIIVPCHVISGFADSRLGFFKSRMYLLHEF